MAELIKLFITATASVPTASGTVVDTTVDPTISRFNALVTLGMIGVGTTTIPATSFFDDDHNAITDLPAIPSDGYVNVYVNGVLQEGSLSTITTTEVVIDTDQILAGQSVVLEYVDFSNTSSTVTSEPTITAPNITVNT